LLKYIILGVAFAGIWPLYLLIRSSKILSQMIWVIVGLLPFVATAISFSHASIISVEWRGYASGVEIQLIDLVALALLFTLKHKNPFFLHTPFVLFTIAVGASVFQAEFQLPAIFAFWQMLKSYLLAYVVARASVEEGVAIGILKGMAIGVVSQAVVVVYQKFAGGYIQPPGTFSHQNEMGLALHFVLYPIMTLWLLAAPGHLWLVASLAGPAVVALIASRATLGLSTVGLALTFMVQSWWNWNLRKTLVIASSGFLLSVFVPVAYKSFETRLSDSPIREDIYDERAAFARAASAIASDHPFGIGANQYSYVVRTYGYALRAGVAPSEANLGNIVHNAYRLTAAETGYLGLVAFLIFLTMPLLTALRWGLPNRHLISGGLLTAMAISLTMVYVHAMFEWILFLSTPFYLLSMTFGMIYGLAYRTSMVRATERSKPPAVVPSYRAGRLIR
jgi:O-antigen ligase